ncbi:phage tail protein [Photobacterium leiognathi]|uniref:phage tail protein n=1 Tax=Photobacterium leiognathi TaxID=553611 RepID=UPI0029823C63|nr:phage tail protein [Photobacterium leiognathi]
MAELQNKLQHLTQFIQTSISSKVLVNKITSYQDAATLQADGEERGNDGLVVAQWRYHGVISIEEFPHRKLDPKVLFALVMCWLTEHDANRDIYELGDPEVEVEVLDHEKADVLIELDFMEPIEMLPDPEGLVLYYGERYTVATVPVDVAEEFEVDNGTGH